MAFGGYGDAVDGLPSIEERELHLWTNAVRVDPQAFNAEYVQAGCNYSQFESSEKSAKSPLYWNVDLNDAARFHSEDMRVNDHFSHDSSDGTSFSERMGRFYTEGAIGENIAWGYADSYMAVMQGWMCSPGHRANIMSGGYNELGTGLDSRYYTQDFGARGSLEERAIPMGIHLPLNPTNNVTFYADFYDSDAVAPSEMEAVLNGQGYPMTLSWGKAAMGVYSASVPLDGAACHAYFFRAVVDGVETRFPEDGMYGWGECSYNDWDSQWFYQQWYNEEDENKKKKLQFAGCSGLMSVPVGVAGLWMGGVFVLLGFRRRV
jgi:hypothetical protein